MTTSASLRRGDFSGQVASAWRSDLYGILELCGVAVQLIKMSDRDKKSRWWRFQRSLEFRGPSVASEQGREGCRACHFPGFQQGHEARCCPMADKSTAYPPYEFQALPINIGAGGPLKKALSELTVARLSVCAASARPLLIKPSLLSVCWLRPAMMPRTLPLDGLSRAIWARYRLGCSRRGLMQDAQNHGRRSAPAMEFLAYQSARL